MGTGGVSNIEPSKFLVLCDGESDRHLFLVLKRCHPALDQIPDKNVRTYDQARHTLRSTRLEANILSLHQDDRPDFIFCYNDEPVLVTELTQHAYTGDNGLQRFARFAAAAESGVPFIYFGPFKRVRDDELDGDGAASARSLTSDVFEGMERLSAIYTVPQLALEWKTDRNGLPATLPLRHSKSDVLTLYGELLEAIYLLLFQAPLRTVGNPLDNDGVKEFQSATNRLARKTNTRASDVKFQLRADELRDVLLAPSSILSRMAESSYFGKGKPDKTLAEHALKISQVTTAQLPNGKVVSLNHSKARDLVDALLDQPKFNKPIWAFYTGYKWRSDPHCGVLVNMDYRLCRGEPERSVADRGTGLIVIYPRISLNSTGPVWRRLTSINRDGELTQLFKARYGLDAAVKMASCVNSKNIFALWNNSAKQARLFRRYADVIVLNDGLILGDSLARTFDGATT